MRAWLNLCRNLKTALHLAARDQARERAAWHAGHATGYRRGQQQRVAKEWRAPCPHCKRVVTWDRDWLDMLGSVAFDDAHRRELWAAHAAEVHGHPYPTTMPCKRCSTAPAVPHEDLCCDCQAEIAGVG